MPKVPTIADVTTDEWEATKDRLESLRLDYASLREAATDVRRWMEIHTGQRQDRTDATMPEILEHLSDVLARTVPAQA